MNRVIDKIKSSLNKDVTAFLTKHKIPLVSILVLVLLTCIGFFVSYAFYQSIDVTPIIGGTTGKIADLDVRVMAEERDTNGNGLGSYALYPYIPKAGYQYNSTKSYCVNKSTINYDATKYEANITASGHDVCYLYFDSTASLDLTLNVYAEDIDSNGVGTGQYTKLETTALPSVGYEFNASKSKCEGGSTISYSADINMFTIESTKKDVCNAYMDAMDVDIQLKIYVQAKKNSTEYYEAKNIPNDGFYDLNSSKSSCTGTSDLSMKNQKVVISATGKTSCVAYLDVSSGPILESMTAAGTYSNTNITLEKSALGTVASTYYYSSDGGKTYTSSTSNTRSFSSSIELDKIKAYYMDANGKTSRVFSVDPKTGYSFSGLYSYSSSVRSKKIDVEGYYKLQVWGAQGGTYNSSYATGGKGGYSVGTVHLNKGDTIYVMTGGQGSYGTSTTLTTKNGGGVNGGGAASYHGGGGGGGTDIRINTNSLYARVIVAGGGGGAHYYSSTYKADGGDAGGVTGSEGSCYKPSYSAATGSGAGQTYGGAGGLASTTADYPGTAGSFGYGGAAGRAYSTSHPGNGAGGGGWYGGGGAGGYASSSNMRAAGGGGGSGYVYTMNTYSNYPSGCLLNSSYWLSSAQTYGGTSSFESTGGGTEVGHSGNGYAKVTFLGQDI